MNTIPRQLSAEQAQYLTDLLMRSRRMLSDAASPTPIYSMSYSSLASEIEDVLAALDIELE